jgi:hypothetical protein
MVDLGLLHFTANAKATASARKRPIQSLPSETSKDALTETVRLASRLPRLTNSMIDKQRAIFRDKGVPGVLVEDGSNSPDSFALAVHANGAAVPGPFWQHDVLPSVRMMQRVQQLEDSQKHADPSQAGFVLLPEQRALCTWFGAALDIALEEESRRMPLHKRKQKTCLLIGAGGLAKPH